ncbi:hypothetical protein [Anaerococcus provencensis]|uniref:hypothetical protein n=1 Tax=Anaerococcus provencensis TaxID=938293 RepID=UPI0005C8DF9A|nr:hypothetical protein [Anaerococcus provencensis]
MQKIKDLSKERKISILILLNSVLIIIFASIHAKNISNSDAYEKFLTSYSNVNYSTYISKIREFKNTLIAYGLVLFVYTIYNINKEKFSLVYKILNCYICFSLQTMTWLSFIPHTVYSNIILSLLVILFILFIIRTGKKAKKK